MKSVASFIALFLLVFSHAVFADEYSDWQGYPPFVTVNDLAEFDGDIYGATKGGLFRYDPESQEYRLYYKNRGLPNNNVNAVAATSDAVYLGFEEDGLWRFDPVNETFSQILFPEYHIKTSENPSGLAIYDILPFNDSVLYVAHKTGVDRLDLANNGIKAYTNLGPDFPENTLVSRIKIIDGVLYACTGIGVAAADESDPNLEFPDRWTDYASVGISASVITDVVKYGTRILASAETRFLYTFNTANGTLNQFTDLRNKTSMHAFETGQNGKVYVAANLLETANRYSGGLYQVAGAGLYIVDDTYTDIITLLTGSDGKIWAGTEINGLQCYTDDGFIDIPRISDLNNNNIYKIALADNDVLWTASAYRDQTPFSTFQRFDGESWSNYTNDFFSRTYTVVSTFVDSRATVWLATWGGGVYVVEDDGTTAIENDILVHIDDEEVIIKPTYERHFNVATDFREDRHGNVWIANFMDPPELIRIEPIASSGAVVVDGYPITKYMQYSPANESLPTAYIYQICPDDDGWVWLGTHTEGVTALYVGDDPFDKSGFDSSQHVKSLKITEGILAVRINAIEFDHDGFVWVGSNGGLNRIVKDGGLELSVFSENDLIKDAITDVLSIEIDHFNNKWIGTRDGLVKIDAENETEAVYSTANSGIFSNYVSALAYDNSKDILWIGTDAGLNRFDVMAGVIDSADLDVRVYPNPFEVWGYDSRATFPGLEDGSSVKIYSFNGDLLREVASEAASGGDGASAEWDGRNFEGRYVGSGVYFFTGRGIDGRGFRDKMVVIRR